MGRENLLRIADALEWNEEHGIRLFRIPFETIPFALHPGSWKKHLEIEGEAIGEFVRKKRMRIFMPLPPTCSISSPDAATLKRSLAYIEHCASLLDFLKADSTSKIIANIGKVHTRRKETAKRFIAAFSRFSPFAQGRIAVENDSIHWSFYDAFGLAGKLNIPIVFNYAAFMQNHFTELSPADTLKIGAMSWKRKDGPQKIRYSENMPGKKGKGSISRRPFLKFYGEIQGMKADVILDTGQGERSVLKAHEYIG